MKVKNRRYIRRLSFKTLWASRKRNLIAILAIALTTLLFTSLFTIILSITSTYETYNCRQLGGYSHGTFKDLSEEQAEKLAAHPKVKASGKRIVCGFAQEGVFGKVPAEVSFMDKNCTKWSYAVPTVGREPEEENEIAMDTVALKLLGVTPELGAEVSLSYTAGDGSQTGFSQTDHFTLVGYWEFDDLMPVHYINVSEDYVRKIEQKCMEKGMDGFRIDLNVMLPTTIDIRGQMEQIDTDLGYDWETGDEENSARIGVNWGLVNENIHASADPQNLMAGVAFLVLVIFTGYLVIYNVFLISVSGDIRFYGLLKKIGTTPAQLKRIIRQQALILCVIGIPAGLLAGYGIGVLLTPVVLRNTILGDKETTLSTSPWIFAGAAIFAFITVFLSCAKPGKMAARVSPVEAVKYAEVTQTKKKSRRSRGAKLYQMAFANLGRSRKKTVLVVVSLALSAMLFQVLCSFVGGFDLEKYVSNMTCADFIVSSTDYFRYYPLADEYISDDTIAEIKADTSETVSGSGYDLADGSPQMWMDQDTYQKMPYMSANKMGEFSDYDHRGNEIKVDVQIEGLDDALFEKVEVVQGDLAPLFDRSKHAIAISVEKDDNGNISQEDLYPKLGESITVIYQKAYAIDTRTGERADPNTPDEYLESYEEEPKEMEYTVCAFVDVPYAMSFRYSNIGYKAVLPADRMREDSEQELLTKFYLFDTPDPAAEQAAETYLAKRTEGVQQTLMYESKASVRAEFEQFEYMFLLLGGILCAIIGLVGILNFFNAVMTGILSRRHEFAVLQSIGMTNRQLKRMLIYEGLYHVFFAVAVTMILSLLISPFIGRMMEGMFWFFTWHFSILPLLALIPVFALLGWLIPALLYGQTEKQSVVERLRTVE